MSKREKKFDAVVRVTFDVRLSDVNEASLEEAVAEFKRRNGLSMGSTQVGYHGPRTRSGFPASTDPKYDIAFSYTAPRPTVKLVSKKARK